VKRIYTLQELKDTIYVLVKDLPVYSVVLFGSYAKGDADLQSDIDLMIDSKGQLKGFDYYALLENLTEAFCKKIDLISKDQIIEESKIEEIVKNEGIVIYERSCSNLEF
jgi:uncharacterized protein